MCVIVSVRRRRLGASIIVPYARGHFAQDPTVWPKEPRNAGLLNNVERVLFIWHCEEEVMGRARENTGTSVRILSTGTL